MPHAAKGPRSGDPANGFELIASLPRSIVIACDAIPHRAMIGAAARQNLDMDHAPLPDLQQAGMHRRGGKAGVVGVNIGSPNGPARGPDHIKRERLSDTAPVAVNAA